MVPETKRMNEVSRVNFVPGFTNLETLLSYPQMEVQLHTSRVYNVTYMPSAHYYLLCSATSSHSFLFFLLLFASPAGQAPTHSATVSIRSFKLICYRHIRSLLVFPIMIVPLSTVLLAAAALTSASRSVVRRAVEELDQDAFEEAQVRDDTATRAFSNTAIKVCIRMYGLRCYLICSVDFRREMPLS